MSFTMAKIELDHVQTFRDRHGKLRCYFRKKGFKRVPLLGQPGSAEFMAAYQAALDGITALPLEIGATRTKAGTISALIIKFYNWRGFATLAPSTQKTYRGIIENFRTYHGDKPVAMLRRKDIERILDNRVSTPAAANNLLRMLRMLMQYAVTTGMRADNPTLGVKPIKYASQGFYTWSEEDIAKFEARHPVGTMARLAMTLMLYTGCRRSDAYVLGRQQIKGGFLTYTQFKNRTRKPVTLTIPVHPELQRVIDATPAQHLTFLTHGFGKPFKSAPSFGNWMKDRCMEARLPECQSHGLRKAVSRRLAELGMSPHQIGAITGHSTLKEIERYTRAASQKLMAEAAMRGLGNKTMLLIEAEKTESDHTGVKPRLKV
jgi:integrase